MPRILILLVVAVAVVAGLYWGMGRQEAVQTTTSPAVTPPVETPAQAAETPAEQAVQDAKS
ncbi:hypothetical protein CNY89_18045, partial [Amaricoccus sp. HAR-UPW-R2A-40]